MLMMWADQTQRIDDDDAPLGGTKGREPPKFIIKVHVRLETQVRLATQTNEACNQSDTMGQVIRFYLLYVKLLLMDIK